VASIVTFVIPGAMAAKNARTSSLPAIGRSAPPGASGVRRTVSSRHGTAASSPVCRASKYAAAAAMSCARRVASRRSAG
jgi:hypothetical protein